MYLGDFADNATVVIHFTTHAENGSLVAPSAAFEATDFRVYKNGSATEKTSANGITVVSPFDSVVGKHVVTIDTSNDTGDAGFWAAGNDYRVEVNSAKTVDGHLQTGVEIGSFSIENRYSGGGGGLDAAGFRAAIGLAAANLDTQLADLPNVVEFDARTLPSADYFVVGDYTAPPTVGQISGKVWQDVYIEDHGPTGYTATTVSLQNAPSSDIKRGSIIQLHDDNGVLVHIAVVTNTTQGSVTFSPPYTGDAFIEVVYFYRLGSLPVPTVAAFEARTLPSADYFVVGDYTAPNNAGLLSAIGNVPSVTAISEEVWNAEERTLTSGGGGGGGECSAEDIVDEIVARGITAIPVQQGVTSAGVIELVQGDTYNGTAKPLLSFPVATNYTDGWAVLLTIRDKDDSVIATASGAVASATQITVSLIAPTGLVFTGCPGAWQGKFDVQVSKDAQRATIARGIAYVYQDQTRT